jgi:hypothetical protein
MGKLKTSDARMPLLVSSSIAEPLIEPAKLHLVAAEEKSNDSVTPIRIAAALLGKPAVAPMSFHLNQPIVTSSK